MEDREKYVSLDLESILNSDFEGFIDLLLDAAGDPLGMDIHYEMVGVNTRDDTVTFYVEYEVEVDD